MFRLDYQEHYGMQRTQRLATRAVAEIRIIPGSKRKCTFISYVTDLRLKLVSHQ